MSPEELLFACAGGRVWIRQWVRAGDTLDREELRVYLGREWAVVVLRDRRWGRVLYCECGCYRKLQWLKEEEWRNAIMGFVKRAKATQGDKATPAPVVDGKFVKDWPAIFDYLTSVVYPDGVERRTSSLTVFCEDGQVKACLNDKDQGLVLFAAGKTFQTCLNALEGLLTSEEPPWRASRDHKPSGPKGKGK